MSDCECATSTAFPQPSGMGFTGQYSPNQGWESQRYSFRHGRMSPSPYLPQVTPAPEFNNQVVPYITDVANAFETQDLGMIHDQLADANFLSDPMQIPLMGLTPEQAQAALECLRRGKVFSLETGKCVEPPLSPASPAPKKESNDNAGWMGFFVGMAAGYFLFK